MVFHPHSFLCHTPPLSLGQKLSGPQWHEKHPGFGPSNRLRKPGSPVGRIAVNRDPFRKLRFGAPLEFYRPSPSFGESFHTALESSRHCGSSRRLSL